MKLTVNPPAEALISIYTNLFGSIENSYFEVVESEMTFN